MVISRLDDREEPLRLCRRQKSDSINQKGSFRLYEPVSSACHKEHYRIMIYAFIFLQVIEINLGFVFHLGLAAVIWFSPGIRTSQSKSHLQPYPLIC